MARSPRSAAVATPSHQPLAGNIVTKQVPSAVRKSARTQSISSTAPSTPFSPGPLTPADPGPSTPAAIQPPSAASTPSGRPIFTPIAPRPPVETKTHALRSVGGNQDRAPSPFPEQYGGKEKCGVSEEDEADEVLMAVCSACASLVSTLFLFVCRSVCRQADSTRQDQLTSRVIELYHLMNSQQFRFSKDGCVLLQLPSNLPLSS